MKVLHIIPSLAKGGAEKMVLDICQELSLREGIHVVLVVLSEKNTFNLESFQFPIKFIPATYRYAILGRTEVNNTALEDEITQFAPDIIHTHLFDAEMVVRLNPRKGVRYFSHAHWNTKEIRRENLKFPITKQAAIDFFVYRKAVNLYKKCRNNFITVSQDTYAYYQKNLPAFKSRIHLIQNAIDTKSYKLSKKLPNGKLKIISIGSLNKRKNQQFQLEIAKALRVLKVDFLLTIVGVGQDYERLKEEIEKSKLQEVVNLYGMSNNVNELLREHHLFLHTAKYEPFGLVILEAMATGLPIVSLNGKGNVILVRDGQNGFIIDEENTALFVKKILTIYTDKTLYKAMRKVSLATALEFDIQPYVTQLTQLYKAN